MIDFFNFLDNFFNILLLFFELCTCTNYFNYCIIIFIFFLVKFLVKILSNRNTTNTNVIHKKLESLMFCWSILDYIAYDHAYTWVELLNYFKNIFIWTAPISDKLAVGDDWMLFSLLIFIICYCIWWFSLNIYHSVILRFLNKNNFVKSKNLKTSYLTLSFFMFLALFLNIFLSLNIVFNFFNDTISFTNQHGATTLFYFIKLLLSLIFILWWFLFILRFNNNKSSIEFSCEVMLLYMILSFLFFIIVSVIDILTFFLILETTSLIISILGVLSIHKYSYHNLRPVEGSLRYFLINALNTGFVLLGISLIYVTCGSLYFWDIGKLCEFILEIREAMPLEANLRRDWRADYLKEMLDLEKKYLWTHHFLWNNLYYFPHISGHKDDAFDRSVEYSDNYLKFNKFIKRYWSWVIKPHILDPKANSDRAYYLPGYYNRYFDLPHKSWFRYFLLTQFLNNNSLILDDVKDLQITRDKLSWIGNTDFEIKIWDAAKVTWNPNKGIFHGIMYYFFISNQYILQNFLINYNLLWHIDNWLFIEMRNTWLTLNPDIRCHETMSHFLRNTVETTEFEYRKNSGDLSTKTLPEMAFQSKAKDTYDKLAYHYENVTFKTKRGFKRTKTIKVRNDNMPIIFILGVVLFFFIFAFKLAWIPFQEWMLQVYRGCGFLYICYLATIPKIAIWFLFAKIYIIYFPTNWVCNIFLFNVGIITILIALRAFSKITNLLGVVAWSSVLTSGFILIYVTYAIYYNAIILLWILFYIVAYTLGILLIFFTFFIQGGVASIEFNTTYQKYWYDNWKENQERNKERNKKPTFASIVNEAVEKDWNDYSNSLQITKAADWWDDDSNSLQSTQADIKADTNKEFNNKVEMEINNEFVSNNNDKEDDVVVFDTINNKGACDKDDFVLDFSSLEAAFYDYDSDIKIKKNEELASKIKKDDFIETDSDSDIELDIADNTLENNNNTIDIFTLNYYLPDFLQYSDDTHNNLAKEYSQKKYNKKKAKAKAMYKNLAIFQYPSVKKAIAKNLLNTNDLKFDHNSLIIIDDNLINVLPDAVVWDVFSDLFNDSTISIYRERKLEEKVSNLDLALLAYQNDNTLFSFDIKYQKIYNSDYLGYYNKLDILNAFIIFNATQPNFDYSDITKNNLEKIFLTYDAIEEKYCNINDNNKFINFNNNNNLNLNIESSVTNISDNNYNCNKDIIVVVDDVKDLSEVSGFGVVSKIQAIFLSIGCFVCVGLPPFGLFIIKFIFLLLGGAWGLQGSQLLISLIPMIWSFGLYGHIIRNIWSTRTSLNLSTPKNITNIIIFVLQCFIVVILSIFFIFFAYLLALSFALFWTKFQ